MACNLLLLAGLVLNKGYHWKTRKNTPLLPCTACDTAMECGGLADKVQETKADPTCHKALAAVHVGDVTGLEMLLSCAEVRPFFCFPSSWRPGGYIELSWKMSTKPCACSSSTNYSHFFSPIAGEASSM